MRDLTFKNLTSSDKRKRIISSSETADEEGVHILIRRHFVCLVREIEGTTVKKQDSSLSVIRIRNTREQRERFFSKFKGSICAVSKGKLFLISYIHSLVVDLEATHQDVAEYRK